MIVSSSISEIRNEIKQARSQGKIIGFVPTMGALHEGHFSLIKAASEKCDYIVASIFVNPTQFGPNEDLDKYPRTFSSDCDGCEKLGTNLIFAPTPEIMYPEECLTWVTVEKLTDHLCGSARPGHFKGVTTVVTKLFNIVQPDYAFFGQKDAQQLSVLEMMTKQLNIPVNIIRCPIVRESDGLAMSSRNKYLTSDQRSQAICLNESLTSAKALFKTGVRNSMEIIDEIKQVIMDYPLANIDYISIVDNETLQPVKTIEKTALAAIAVYFDQTRLIDNKILIP